MNVIEADHTFLTGLTVLYVEDDQIQREATAAFLKRRVKRLVVADNGDAGLVSYRQELPDILVTDIQMPNMDGLALVEAIHADAPNLPVVVTTAFEQTDYLLRAIELGVDRYVLKPMNVDRLEAALLFCAQILRLRQESEALHQAKADLIQAQHEETLGILAGGMAHDYNNLMQAVMSMVAMARYSIEKPKQALGFMAQAEAGVATTKELGSNLLMLSHTRDLDRQTGSIIPVLRQVLDRSFQPPANTVTYSISDDLPDVRFNKRHMERVFEILAKNATEAMGGDGAVHVDASLITVSLHDHLPLGAGNYVHLTIRDSGKGIDPKIYPIMFSPYSSSKERGSQRGMGMGLAIAQAIMKLHHGTISAGVPADEGAALHLYLPVPQVEEPVG